MRPILLFLALLCPVEAQQRTFADVEQSIAALPADQRAYERFRFWVTQQPRDSSGADLSDKYIAYLAEHGFTRAEAESQFEAIKKQYARLEVERWNRILTSEKPAFNTQPNEFLVEMAKGLKPGAALDVGMGQGRNAIWLAKQGWDVTGFDPAEKAVALAEQNAAAAEVKIKTELKTIEEFDFGERRWDLILLSYVGGRGLADRLQRALKPGGAVIVEAFHRDATKGNSIGGSVVFDTGELPNLFPFLRVVRYEEPVAKADFGRGMVRVVRYCAALPE